MSRVLEPFDYFEPQTLEEAVALLEPPGSRVMAGGVDLILMLRMRKVQASRVINIQNLSELDYVEVDEKGVLHVGAMTSMQKVAEHPKVNSDWTALAEGNAIVGSLQTKIMGTMVGNLCVSTPVSDVSPALYAMGGEFVVVGPSGERSIAAEDFFTGLGTTSLTQGEMVREVTLQPHASSWGSALLKAAKTHDDISKACVGVALAMDGNKIFDARIAMGAVAVTTVRAAEAEASLQGQDFSESLATEAGNIAAANIQPITDVRSTVAYRKHIIGIMIRDALIKSASRLKGEEV